LLGNVLTVENTNLNSWWSVNLTLPGWGHIINGVITIIIWEALIERLSEGLSSIKWVMKWWSGGGLWDSLDHHGDGDVIVIGEILGFVSILLEDGVEGVVTNNLSERFESNRFDVIKTIGWGNFKVNSFNFIDWYHNFLGELVEVVLGLSFGVNENLSFWGWVGGLGGVGINDGLDESNTFVLPFTRLFVVMLVLRFNSRLS